jgi:hypothetical protein
MEVGVNAVTAAIALVAIVVSWRAYRGQASIQERLTRVEEARRTDEVAARGRAQVTGTIRRQDLGGKAPNLRLVLRNDGPALAHKVRVEKPEVPGVPGVIGLEMLPVDLQPGQEVPFIVTVGLRDTPTLPLVVRWIDGAGDHKEPWTLQVY